MAISVPSITRRRRIMGLPIGRRRTDWRTVGLLGTGAAIAGVGARRGVGVTGQISNRTHRSPTAYTGHADASQQGDGRPARRVGGEAGASDRTTRRDVGRARVRVATRSPQQRRHHRADRAAATATIDGQVEVRILHWRVATIGLQLAVEGRENSTG